MPPARWPSGSLTPDPPPLPLAKAQPPKRLLLGSYSCTRAAQKPSAEGVCRSATPLRASLGAATPP